MAVPGEKFGKLTTIEPMERRTAKGCVRWLCQCDCGKMAVVASDNLSSGVSTSCGCRKLSQKVGCRIYQNAKFGELTTIEEMLAKDHGAKRWLCRCSCGQLTVVRSGSLTSGNTQSCGCKRRGKRTGSQECVGERKSES